MQTRALLTNITKFHSDTISKSVQHRCLAERRKSGPVFPCHENLRHERAIVLDTCSSSSQIAPALVSPAHQCEAPTVPRSSCTEGILLVRLDASAAVRHLVHHGSRHLHTQILMYSAALLHRAFSRRIRNTRDDGILGKLYRHTIAPTTTMLDRKTELLHWKGSCGMPDSTPDCNVHKESLIRKSSDRVSRHF